MDLPKITLLLWKEEVRNIIMRNIMRRMAKMARKERREEKEEKEEKKIEMIKMVYLSDAASFYDENNF